MPEVYERADGPRKKNVVKVWGRACGRKGCDGARRGVACVIANA
ncbi:hypothetical protein C7S14_0869 [Burkholderia cepacia]|nr:hypothetical protein C7S14_0869 [Burkholderia cepacia]